MSRSRHPGAPWAAALDDRIVRRAPDLHVYFGGVPYGAHGIGEGVFTTVGSPRRWLWPLLAVLGRWNVLRISSGRVGLDMPLVGRLYEYSGAFSYRVEPTAPGFT